MKCCKCGKRFDELCSLTEYGCNKVGVVDHNEYCNGCFDEEYPDLHVKEKQDEEGDK